MSNAELLAGCQPLVDPLPMATLVMMMLITMMDHSHGRNSVESQSDADR
jgi:hypothetical protein